MSEPKINVSSGFNGGVSVSLRGDSGADIEALLTDAATSPTLTRLLQQAGILVPDQQGVQNVQQAFPQAAPVSTVGQPLPTPAPWNQPVAQPGATPPGLVDPGPCAHGPRQYKDSMARGAQWRRWECAIPWSKGAVGRCKPVDA